MVNENTADKIPEIAKANETINNVNIKIAIVIKIAIANIPSASANGNAIGAAKIAPIAIHAAFSDFFVLGLPDSRYFIDELALIAAASSFGEPSSAITASSFSNPASSKYSL